jgi:putative ABC transport system ATP-binding protein
VALIEVRGLTKLYRMGDTIVRALDGVDLAIEQGEFVAITGASGSGKSTMMHLLGCLDRPTGGTYHLAGRDVSGLSDRELAAVRNRQIGFVFQTFNLINRTTALENVGVPLFYARQTNSREPARRALERVGLTTRSTHQPNELSGGERQRVAIARAIVNNPLLLLADEPTGNLDSRTGEQIMAIVHALNEQGVTIIIVTHEQEIAEQARRIVQMRDGKILSDRLTKDILAHDGHSRARKLAGIIDPAAGVAEPAAVPVGAPDGPIREAPATLPYAQQLTPRLVRGANATLGCGIAAIAAWALAIALLIVVGLKYAAQFQPPPPGAPPKMPSPEALRLAMGSGLLFLAGVGLGILAVVFWWTARRRMRLEPGNWQGRKRLWVGLILGGVPVLLFVVGILVNIVKLLFFRQI